MFEQITPTFEIKPTFEKEYGNEDMSKYMNDEMMMDSCAELTKRCIDAGVSLKSIGQVVTDFQRKYIHIDKCDPNMSKHFTVDAWWKTSNINDKNKV